MNTIGDPSGGFITLNSGVSAGDLVTIVSNIPENRTIDYQDNGDFLPDTVNDDFDRVVSLVKQQEDRASRTLAFQESQQNAGALTLPNPVGMLYLRWKGDLTGLENVDLATSGAPTTSDLVTYTTKANSVTDELDFLNTEVTTLQAQTARIIGDNYLVNDFEIWKRGESITGYTTAAVAFLADRWGFFARGDTGSCDVNRSTTVIDGKTVNAIEYDMTIPNVTGDGYLGQIVEGDALVGEEVTFSVYVDVVSLSTGFYLEIRDSVGQVNSVNVTTSGRYTLTGTTNSAATADSVQVAARVPVGSTANFKLAQAKLELGSVATDFEYRSTAETIAICNRFCRKSYNIDVDPGTVTDVGSIGTVSISTLVGQTWSQVNWDIPMRDTPTITLYDPNVLNSTGNWNRSGVAIAASISNAGQQGFYVNNSAVTLSGNFHNIHYLAESEIV